MTDQGCSLKDRRVLIGKRMAKGLPDVLEQRDLDLMSLADAIYDASQDVGHVLTEEEVQLFTQHNLKDPVSLYVDGSAFAGYLWNLEGAADLGLACSRRHALIAKNTASSQAYSLLTCKIQKQDHIHSRS